MTKPASWCKWIGLLFLPFLIAAVSPEDPSELVLVKHVDTGITYGLAITETHLFTTTNTGLSIYDMSDPIDPKPVSATGDGKPWFCVTVDGPFAYAGGESGFAVVDISDIRKPEIIGRFSDGGDVYNVELFDHYRRHRRVRYRRSSPSRVPVQVVGISGDTGCLCVWTDPGHDHGNGGGGP
jgi:hypothetical protein